MTFVQWFYEKVDITNGRFLINVALVAVTFFAVGRFWQWLKK